MATGGMSTPCTDVMRTQFANDDVAFVVERAHAAGLPVTAHAHGLPAVEQALAAGVDAMEHCSCLTDDGVRVTDEVLQTLVERQLLVGAALGAPPPEVYNLAPAAVKAMHQRAGVTFEQVRAMRLQRSGRCTGQSCDSWQVGTPAPTLACPWLNMEGSRVQCGGGRQQGGGSRGCHLPFGRGMRNRGSLRAAAAPDATRTSSLWAAICRQTSRDWPTSMQWYSGARG
jgi:hypothetical protein